MEKKKYQRGTKGNSSEGNSRRAIVIKKVQQYPLLSGLLACLLVVILGLWFSTNMGFAKAATSTLSSVKTPIRSKVLPTPFAGQKTTNKHVTPIPLITSCPSTSLPQPGVVNIAVPDTDPAYFFSSSAVGVSDGTAYTILAGYVKATPSQGIIATTPISSDPCKDYVAGLQHNNPAAAARSIALSPDGDITITGVSGNLISFHTANGTSGHFDFIKQSFQP